MVAKIYFARGPVRWYLKAVGFWGITLPPFGIFILAEHMDNESLKRHETVHWEQAKRMGVFKFYALYLWYMARYGYAKHPMEIEARAVES